MKRFLQWSTGFIFCLIFGFPLVGGAAPFQSARIQGITLQADSLFRDSENEIVELEGHVQVIFQNQHLKCEKARINLRAKTVDAWGDVLVTSTQANIGGDRVVLDYESSTGVIYSGYVQSGTVLFEGSVINKTSEVDYLANDAKYTACTTCPEAWSFSGTKIRAELGGYAYIKSSWMHFGGVPFFWLPYLIVPLKSDRQTGLLTPTIDIESPGGLVLGQPFFWAISRSQDATMTVKNYELRGVKPLLEYNYMLGPSSYGRLNAGYLRDKVFASEERVNTFRSPYQQNDVINRWAFNYSHYYELPDGYVHRVQLNNASDLQYVKDFSSETAGYMDPALENRVSITKNTRAQHFSADSSYYINQLQSDPLAGNDDAVHRLPEIRFSQALEKLGNSDFIYSVNVDYVNFARNGPAYDDLNATYNPNGTNNRGKANTCYSPTNPYYTDKPGCVDIHDGVYNEGQDLIRTGQRLDLQANLYRPIKLGPYVDLLPKVGYRETSYSFAVGDNANISRRYLLTEVSAKTTASGVFGDTNNTRGDSYKHEIQPELTATTVPWYNQPYHPFFGSQGDNSSPVTNQQSVGDTDLNSPFGLQFDYNDRIFSNSLVTLALTNKVTRKTWVSDTPQYLQFFSWKISQSYDLLEAQKKNSTGQPLSDIASDLRFTLPRSSFIQQVNYFPYLQVTNSTSTLNLYNENRDALSVRYIRQYSTSVAAGQIFDTNSRTDQYKVTLRKYNKKADFLATTVYDVNPNTSAEDRFKLLAYGVEIKIPGDCSSIQIFDKIEDHKREQKIQFGFVWDGQAKSTFINKLSADATFGI
jgi:LPS-assembly protein